MIEILREAGLPAGTRIVERSPLDHQSNRLYDVWSGHRHLILKEFLKADEHSEAPVREYRALELLAPLDLAPRPVLLYAAQAAAMNPFVLYEFMEGTMWDRRSAGPSDLDRLARGWLAINDVPAVGLLPSRGHGRTPRDFLEQFEAAIGAYSEWADAEFPAARPAATLIGSALERITGPVGLLEDLDPVLCFSRADARFANVIERPDGRLGFVDWEDSGLRDPARDVADLMTAANQEDLVTRRQWDAFLEPYVGGRSAVDPTLDQRIRAYLWLFPMFWLSLLLRACLRRIAGGDTPHWLVNGLPVEQRLRRSLARALTGPDRDPDEALGRLAAVRFLPEAPGGGEDGTRP